MLLLKTTNLLRFPIGQLITVLGCIALLLATTGCKDENCDFPIQPLAPSGYVIKELTQTPAKVDNTRKWQMLGPALGYYLDDETLYRITNGGITWTSVQLPTEGTVTDFVFIDENIGYLTYSLANDRADLLKTTNGGLTFEQLSYPTLNSYFRYIAADADGRLYAQIGAFDDSVGILRSDDGGMSFSRIFSSSQPFISNLKVVDDQLYFLESGENLQVTSLEGSPLATHPTPVVNNDAQLLVLSKNELLFNGRRGVFRSTNGGADWSTVDEGFNAQLIDGSVQSGTLITLIRPFCGDNLNEPSALALFNETLSVGETIQNVDPWNTSGVLIEEDKWLLLVNGSVWEIGKM